MPQFRRAVLLCVATLLPLSTIGHAQGDTKKPESKRPQLTLKASPTSGVVPVSILGVAELKGGSDDFEEFYCAGMEWDWDDGTVSESSNDCEPYESGKSQIRRRFTVTHSYKQGGRYRIAFRLKQKSKTVGLATAVVQLLSTTY